MLEPQIDTTVRNYQATQKTFKTRSKILTRSDSTRLGPVTYLVDMNDDVVWRRQVDHIKPFQETSANEILSRG